MTARLARLWGVVLAAAVWTGCTVELQHDLTEEDANDIYVLLQKNGIDAKKMKEEGGNEPKYFITVAKQDVAAAAELLREYSLPRPHADGLAIFKKAKGMIPTQTEERAMFIEALGGEVSNSLNRIPGVLEARTIVMIPEVTDLTQPDKAPQPSASVFIKYRLTAENAPPIKEDEVKRFVATAVPEMRPESVTVLMTRALPPEVKETEQLQTVLGLRMTKGSATQFKLMVAVSGLLVLAMAGITSWNFIRGAGAGRRRRTAGDG